MIAVPPIDCTAPGVLTSTTAVDADAWDVGVAYALNDVVSAGGYNWTSLEGPNTGHTPATEPLWWTKGGVINSLAMFDTSVQTATSNTGGLSWTLSVGRFTCIGLMGLVGQSVTLDIEDGATLIYTETRTLASSDGTYYGFCFEAPYQTDAAVFSGLLSSPTCTVTISIATSPAATAACGLCVIGKQFFLGDALYGFANPIEDRGRHYLDSLKNPVNVERGYSKGVSGVIVTERAAYNRLMGFLAANIGVPMLWVAAPGQNDFVSANAFGRYVSAVPVIDSHNSITLALEIAGYR
ncbi:MAG: hypothetical protein Q8R67_05110 [Rhodoferax sp.]|nr:hypothetical protein [Rhodoferax sp.]MDP3651045.1 hypothetical protein [Rhodoferax sp.]